MFAGHLPLGRTYLDACALRSMQLAAIRVEMAPALLDLLVRGLEIRDFELESEMPCLRRDVSCYHTAHACLTCVCVLHMLAGE